MGSCLGSPKPKPPILEDSPIHSPSHSNPNEKKPDQIIENSKKVVGETTFQANPIEKKPDQIIENDEKKPEKTNPNQNQSKEIQKASRDSNIGKSGLGKMKSQNPEDLEEEVPTTHLVNQKNKEIKNRKLILE